MEKECVQDFAEGEGVLESHLPAQRIIQSFLFSFLVNFVDLFLNRSLLSSFLIEFLVCGELVRLSIYHTFLLVPFDVCLEIRVQVDPLYLWQNC